ncbi:MAG: class I SAM-dependent methyltransferase [Pseudomonadota bacterium]
MLSHCPACGNAEADPVFRLDHVPVLCNQLWPTEKAARAAPLGDVDLRICSACALIWNSEFDSAEMEYTVGYENALHFSQEFRDFANGLAKTLIDRNDLSGQNVVEVGAGDGYFLETLVANGVKSATGYDPSLPPEKVVTTGDVRVVAEAFHPDQLSEPLSAIMCRHVLEHLTDPLGVLTEMRRALPDDFASVYVEVPNAGWMLRSTSIWDIIYEHVTYWTAPSMACVFDRAGLAVTGCDELYNDQFLGVQGRRSTAAQAKHIEAIDLIRRDAASFRDTATALVSDWRAFFASMSGRAVIWGAGSKGTTLANVIGGKDAGLVALVDQNPRKHGKYIPGAGLPVIAPDTLPDFKPDCVVISNGLYRNEIQTQIKAMGIDAQVKVLAS